MNEIKVIVRGMNCNHCKITVESGLKKISGIDTAIADVINGEVTLRGQAIDLDHVKKVVEDLGYMYSGEAEQIR